MMKILTILSICLLPVAMQAGDFVAIKEWDEVQPFAGRLVAYQGSIVDSTLMIDDVAFGYVRKHWTSLAGIVHYYILQRIEERPSYKRSDSVYLSSTLLSKASLYMRAATLKETKQIQALIEAYRASFTSYQWRPLTKFYIFDREASLALIKKKLQQAQEKEREHAEIVSELIEASENATREQEKA
jgi:hypothetical protein